MPVNDPPDRPAGPQPVAGQPDPPRPRRHRDDGSHIGSTPGPAPTPPDPVHRHGDAAHEEDQPIEDPDSSSASTMTPTGPYVVIQRDAQQGSTAALPTGCGSLGSRRPD